MDATPDVIGSDDEPSRRWPGLRAPDRGPSVVLAAAAVGLVVGTGLGALWSPVGSRTPVERGSDAVDDGGVVHLCDGRARAFVFARDLPPERTEVHLPLRGDDALLPVLTDGTFVLDGDAVGTQTFVPAADGSLTVVVPLATARGPEVAAEVGGRRLALEVRTCGGAPTWGSGPTT